MMRKARPAIRKVNVALDSPGYCFAGGFGFGLHDSP